jgi:hypothetical protein
LTWLYLRYRTRIAWARLKPGSRKDWGYRILIGVIALIYTPLIGVMYWGLNSLFHTIASGPGLDILERLLHLPAAAYGVLLLFLIFNRVHPVLFESADGELLRSLPVGAAQITHARMTGLAILMSPLLVLFLPLTVFYGREADAAIPYYAVAFVLVALFCLTLFGFGALLTSALTLAAPARGLRGVSKYGTLIVLIPAGTAAFMLMPMVRQLDNVADQMLEYADYVAVGPIAWLTSALVAAAHGTVGDLVAPLAALLACSLACWGACVALAPRLAAGDVFEAAPATIGTASGFGWWAPGWLASTDRALWRREMTAVRAEAARTILLPLAMITFFAVMSRVSTAMVAMPLVVSLMAVSMLPGLSMASVGQEGRAFWVLRNLPIPIWRVLVVKLTVRTSVGVLALALLVATAYLVSSVGTDGQMDLELPLPFTIAPTLVPWTVAMIVVGLVLSSVWGLAIGARFPRFIPPRKGQYVGVGASLAGSFTPIVMHATLVLSLLPLQIDSLRHVLWFLPLAVLVFWIGASLLLLAWAAWHLESLEDLPE